MVIPVHECGSTMMYLQAVRLVKAHTQNRRRMYPSQNKDTLDLIVFMDYLIG
jgi:hypothetical protein